MSTTAVPAPPTRPPFAWFAAGSTVHDPTAIRALVDAYAPALRAMGAQAWEPGPASPALPLVVFVATGGTERVILETVPFDAREPALLLAHPGQNSLPAALEVLARLQQRGLRGEVQYLRGPADGDGLQRLGVAIHDRAVRRALLASRIGLVGEPSDWLVASQPPAETVRDVWGPTVVRIPLGTILAAPDPADAAGDEALARDFGAGAAARVEPAEADLHAAAQVHAQLRRVVEARRLDAVAVRCFDLVVRRGTTGCLALAHLNDEGIVAGCEGDLVATVAMLWLRRMTGALSWMANPARVDVEGGILSLAHCTVPRGLSGPYRLRSHFESGLGVGIQGTLPAGPVTLVRLGGPRMERLRALDGALLRNTDHADLCRTQVEVEVGGAALRDLLAQPLGNHLVLVPGHHAAGLRRWHAAMIA